MKAGAERRWANRDEELKNKPDSVAIAENHSAG